MATDYFMITSTSGPLIMAVCPYPIAGLIVADCNYYSFCRNTLNSFFIASYNHNMMT